MTDVSVLIPSRNEEFLKRTVEGVLATAEMDTEVIVVLDGEWADPGLEQHPKVTVVYVPESIGQRAATNLAAKLSTAKYVMKLDAHCILGQGWDRILMEDCEPNWTVIPRMYNLHAFNWKCTKCGDETYQGPEPTACIQPNMDKIQAAVDAGKNIKGTYVKDGKAMTGSESKRDIPLEYRTGCTGTKFERAIVWAPRDGKAVPEKRENDYTRFDRDLHFQYWGGFNKRAEAKGDITDVMGNLGACWFMERDRYWELEGLDQEHGSWGQMGVEISCKTWLSGGRQVVNKRTWFSHLFRTQGASFSFPYPQSGTQVKHARKHSQDMWLNSKWPKQIHRLPWLINKFHPPEWPTKGIVYYTDSQLDHRIACGVRGQLEKAELPIVSVSLKPLNWQKNITLDLERSKLTMFKQILAGLEASTADIIFFCEHDVLYDPSHFDFMPEKEDVYYYNENVWKVDANNDHKPIHYDCKQTSALCAYRETLITHYRERVRRVESDGHSNKMGYEPGTHNREERIDDLKSESWFSPVPNIDIRHDGNLTKSRWSKEQFRSQRNCKNWQEADEVPGWESYKELIGV
jgi:hypothetical protein